MRYRRVEEGIARAARQAVHYTPEILNPLSAALIGASGFVNGHIRWMLLILGFVLSPGGNGPRQEA